MFSISGQSLPQKSASEVCRLWASTVVQEWPKQHQQIGLAPSSKTLFTDMGDWLTVTYGL